VRKFYIPIFVALFITGCATTAPPSNSEKAKLVGVSTPVVPVPGPIEHVYFTTVDGVEYKSVWSGYPEELEIDPGKRVVVVVCEWKPTTTGYILTEDVRRVEDTFKAGHVYKFTSTLEQTGGCLISYEDVTAMQSN